MTHPKEPDMTHDPEPALSLPPAVRERVRRLDRICSTLEDSIFYGRGDVKAMRAEWRACQDEMAELEKGAGG